MMKDLIRDVDIDGHRLRLYDTGRVDSLGKCRLAYDFTLPGETSPLFQGDDFCCSPLHAIDSDECVRALLGFLTLRPGDTDSEYFESYTQAQLAWANSYECESMQLWTLDDCKELFQEWKEENDDARE